MGDPAAVATAEWAKVAEWADLRLMKDTVEQRFPLKFLTIFTAISYAFPTAELYFSKNQSLIVKYSLEQINGQVQSTISSSSKSADNSLGYISYFIKPSLQKDGRRDDEINPDER